MCLKGELTKASKILCCTVKFSVAPGLQEVFVYVRELLESKTEESIVNITPSCRLQSFYIRNSWKELLHEDALHRTEVLSLHVPSLILDVFSSSFLVLFTTYAAPVTVWHTVCFISLSSHKVLQAVGFVCCIHCCDFSACFVVVVLTHLLY